MYNFFQPRLIHGLCALALLIIPTLLTGQRCQVRVDDILGMRTTEEWKDSTYQVREDNFDLTISNKKYQFKFAKIEIREDQGQEILTDASAPLHTMTLKFVSKDVITTSIQVGQFALDKRYEIRVIYLRGNTSTITRKAYFIRRKP
jgi:hypothetical protein